LARAKCEWPEIPATGVLHFALKIQFFMQCPRFTYGESRQLELGGHSNTDPALRPFKLKFTLCEACVIVIGVFAASAAKTVLPMPVGNANFH
jgi:hypothetical protein